MGITVRLTEKERDNARMMAIQHKKTVNELIQDIVSTMLSGQAACIVLIPSPPPETLHEVREAVNKVINKERSLIYVPDFTANGR